MLEKIKLFSLMFALSKRLLFLCSGKLSLLTSMSSFYVTDVALLVLRRHPNLAVSYGSYPSPLSLIAQQPSAFPSGARFTFWQRFITFWQRFRSFHSTLQLGNLLECTIAGSTSLSFHSQNQMCWSWITYYIVLLF